MKSTNEKIRKPPEQIPCTIRVVSCCGKRRRIFVATIIPIRNRNWNIKVTPTPDAPSPDIRIGPLGPDGIWNSQSIIPAKPRIPCHRDASFPRSSELSTIAAAPIIQSKIIVTIMLTDVSSNTSQDIATRSFITIHGRISVTRTRQPQISSQIGNRSGWMADLALRGAAVFTEVGGGATAVGWGCVCGTAAGDGVAWDV